MDTCSGCGKKFKSTYAFDMHRTGKFGVDRRCRTTKEMRAMGMQTNGRGLWVSEAMKPTPILGG